MAEWRWADTSVEEEEESAGMKVSYWRVRRVGHGQVDPLKWGSRWSQALGLAFAGLYFSAQKTKKGKEMVMPC